MAVPGRTLFTIVSLALLWPALVTAAPAPAPDCQERCIRRMRGAVGSAAERRCSLRCASAGARRSQCLRTCRRRVLGRFALTALSGCTPLCRQSSTQKPPVATAAPNTGRPPPGQKPAAALKAGQPLGQEASNTTAPGTEPCQSGCLFRFPYEVTVRMSPRGARQPLDSSTTGNRASLADQLKHVEQLLERLIHQLGFRLSLLTAPQQVVHRHIHQGVRDKIDVHVHNTQPHVSVYNNVQAVSRSESGAAARADGAAAAQRAGRESNVTVTGNDTARMPPARGKRGDSVK